MVYILWGQDSNAWRIEWQVQHGLEPRTKWLTDLYSEKRKAPILPKVEARCSGPFSITNPDELGADPDASKSMHDEPTLSVSHHGSGVKHNVDNKRIQ